MIADILLYIIRIELLKGLHKYETDLFFINDIYGSGIYIDINTKSKKIGLLNNCNHCSECSKIHVCG